MMFGERSRFASVASVVTATVVAFLVYNSLLHDGSKRASAETENAPCISAFQLFLEGPSEMDASNQALALLQEEYSEDYYHSSISHHHFVRTAPVAIQDALSKFVWTDFALKEVRSKFDSERSIQVIPDVFDEIYLMRPEFDLVDQKKVHYDGNLKIPGLCTIRALTYLSGKDATLFALTTEANFTTSNHTAVVLDFDRELHYASLNHPTTQLSMGMEEMQYSEPRVMVKSALHVILPGTHPGMVYFRIVLHRIMVFAARTFRRAFESKSHAGTNAPLKSNLVSMMAVDNLMRSLNKIHMALPLILIGLPLGAVFLAPVLYPAHFLPYVAVVIARFLFLMTPTAQLANVLFSFLVIAAISGIFLPRSTSSYTLRLKTESKTHVMKTSSHTSPKFFSLVLLHIAWISICFYVEANSEMASHILLAPWQQVITLDDII